MQNRMIVLAGHAKVSLIQNVFVATLSDGRCIEQPDTRHMAYALFRAGVLAEELKFEWRTGCRMLTAGQQIGLSSEMRRLEREGRHDLLIAA